MANLRSAFRWLSVNSWPFMEATMHHELWETEELAGTLEDLLREYNKSIGGVATDFVDSQSTGPADATPSADRSSGLDMSGVPAELLQGASRISPEQAAVLASGPADCVAQPDEEDATTLDGDVHESLADQCAGIIDGGVDEITPVQIWNEIMKKYKVAQLCDEELLRLRTSDKEDEKAVIRQRQAVAVAAAVEALSKLHRMVFFFVTKHSS